MTWTVIPPRTYGDDKNPILRADKFVCRKADCRGLDGEKVTERFPRRPA